MSMIAYLRPVEESGIAELSSFDCDRMAEYLFPEEEGEEEEANDLDLDKAWHAIHFLLCGSAEGGSGPLVNAVLGGKAVGPDIGYGPVRWLSATQVHAVANHLPRCDELLSRFDAPALQAADIYPGIWERDEDEDHKEYIADYYEAMRDVYQQASQAGQAMLSWLS